MSNELKLAELSAETLRTAKLKAAFATKSVEDMTVEELRYGAQPYAVNSSLAHLREMGNCTEDYERTILLRAEKQEEAQRLLVSLR